MLDHDFAYHVTRVLALSEQVSHVFLRPVKAALSYTAGQYAHVLHQDKHVSLLSIANAPRENNELEFHLFHPPQNAYAKDLLHMAQHEKIWHLRGPFGHCTVDKLEPFRPVIFIARGTGFAPVKAVIESLVNHTNKNWYPEKLPPLSLYWFMTQRGAFYLQDQLEAWRASLGLTYQLIIQHQKTDFSPVIRHHPYLKEAQVYASASPDFVHAAFAALEACGLERGRFFSDVFE